MKLIFKQSKPVISNVKTFVFSPAEPLVWQAGQYIHYVLPHEDADDRGTERWFTISSAPFEEDVCITTRIFDDEASSFKKALSNLTAGHELEVDPPEGGFTISDTSRHYVFIAGGIGITPFRSILKQLDFEGKEVKIDLLYANKTEEDVVFKDELEALSAKHPEFTITYFIGENIIDEVALKQFHSSDNPYIYISGPEPMVDSVKEKLTGIGFDESQIKLDHFPGYKEI